jgi:hypothetical protein
MKGRSESTDVAQPLELEGFVAFHGFVTFRVDQPPELGTITFSSPADRKPICSGLISKQTLQIVTEHFHGLGLGTRQRMFEPGG